MDTNKSNPNKPNTPPTSTNKKSEKKGFFKSPKNWLLIGFGVVSVTAAAFAFNAANEKVKMQSELEDRLEEKDYLMNTFVSIETNLRDITRREGLLMEGMDGDVSSENSIERIVSEVDAIESLISENNTLIESLQQQMAEQDNSIAGFEKTVANLKSKIANYKNKNGKLYTEISVLKDSVSSISERYYIVAAQLDSANALVSEQDHLLSLQSSEIRLKDSTITVKDQKIRTKYYTVATKKELKDKEIVEKSGIFASKAVNRSINSENFTAIDMYDETVIQVQAKDVELISKHTPGSYKIIRDSDKQVKEIEITDPEKFWSTSKYLVVAKQESGSAIAFW